VRIVVHDLVLAAERDGEIVVHGLVVEEVLANHVAAIAQAQHELAKAVMSVDLHDVPQDGPTADLDHGLGSKFSFLAQSRPHAAAQDDRLHRW
jgi:hypothetical protein